jgi:hypothetical protein
MYKRLLTSVLFYLTCEQLWRAFLIVVDGSVFALDDFAGDTRCQRRDDRFICSFSVRAWPYFEVGIALLKMMLMWSGCVMVCKFRKMGGVLEVQPDVWKIMLWLRVLALLSFGLFSAFFGGVSPHVEETRGLYVMVLLTSLATVMVTELVHRRLIMLSRVCAALAEFDSAQKRVESLPQMTFHEAQDRFGNNLEATCTICLADFEQEDLVARMSCRHTFHKECIRDWLATGSDRGCPMRCQQAENADQTAAPPAWVLGNQDDAQLGEESNASPTIEPHQSQNGETGSIAV